MLDKNGFILFSIFGPLTFYELNESLTEFCGKNIHISASNFRKRPEIKNILTSLFEKSSIEEIIYKKRYPSLLKLLKHIKYTGTRGSGLIKKNFWTPKSIDNIEKIYKNKFKNIVATYQVFFCKGIRGGWKNGESYF